MSTLKIDGALGTVAPVGGAKITWADERYMTAAVVEMRDACEAAAKTFRWYEELHAAKGPEHADKAARNRTEAEKLEAVLARVEVSR
jgi:hypothetical protein